MSQHDYDLANQTRSSFRADLNNALLAIVSQNSEATEPSTTFAYQFWADTTTGILKQRNAANTAWISLMTMSSGVMLANAALAGSASQDFAAKILTLDNLLKMKTGANIASAATINLSTATGNLVHITGTTATSAVTMTAGQWMRCIADGAWPLTYHATTNRISGGANITLAAGDTVDYFYDGTTVIGNITKADGTAVVAAAAGGLTAGTLTATTSGTSVDITGIPAGTKYIVVQFSGVSVDATTNLRVQLGDSGGIETSGYTGNTSGIFASGAGSYALSAGFDFYQSSGAASYTYSGHIILSLITGTTWCCSGQLAPVGVATTFFSTGQKALTAELTQIRLTTVSGTANFDAGNIKVLYE